MCSFTVSMLMPIDLAISRLLRPYAKCRSTWYLSTAAADFVAANRDKLSGVKRQRKQTSDYSARPQPDASPYASRPVAGVM